LRWRQTKLSAIKLAVSTALHDGFCVLVSQKAYYTHGRQVTLNSNFLKFSEIEKGCQPLAIAVGGPFGVQFKG